jgi:hypothetical protein
VNAVTRAISTFQDESWGSGDTVFVGIDKGLDSEKTSQNSSENYHTASILR